MVDAAELNAQFLKLSPTRKAKFLAHVAHEATIAARMSYVPSPSHPTRNFDNPDGPILRDANNFVHRIVGYIPHVLDGTKGKDQDAFVVEMIVEFFGEHSNKFSDWLKQ